MDDKTADHIYTGYFENSDDELKTQISKADEFDGFGYALCQIDSVIIRGR